MSDPTTIEPSLSQQLSRIDAPMERKRLGDMEVSKFAGLSFQEYRECVEFAKLASQSRHGIPPYLRGNPGDCLVITTQALRWRIEPIWTMQHSYIAKAESLIAYDSAVHNAIVLSSGILKSRPRYTFDGQDEMRTCTVSAWIKGEEHPHEYTTPPLSKCRPARNESGVVKGSPLWDKDTDQMLAYYGMRSWSRRFAPELLAGVYDREEFSETTQEETAVMPPSPNLMARLPGKMEGAGFQENVVDQGLAEEAEKQAADAKAERKAHSRAGKAKEGPSEGEPAQSPAPAEAAPAPPAEPARPPETAGEYQVYCMKWIEATTDPDNLEARWDGETDMRAQCKVPLGVRKMLEGALKAKVNGLKAKRAKK
jgi:hypothetical protein